MPGAGAAIVGSVGARRRTFAIVAAIAVAAAGATAAVALLQSDKAPAPVTGAAARSKPLTGFPPLVLELGVRTDPEAVALRKGMALVDAGKRQQAATIFLGYKSLEGQVAQLIAQWSSDSSLRGLQALALENPDSGLVQLHLGIALVWVGRIGDAQKAWRLAAQKDPDSPYAVRATDLLHPELPRGLPVFIPSFPDPTGLDGLTPAQQLDLLRSRADKGRWQDRIVYGIALERLNRRLSAGRQFQLAAAAAPDNPEALTAAAFGQFDKENPTPAFSKLGPLSQRFPKAATVRYHLGVLLLWLGEVANARKQLNLAVSTGAPGSAIVTSAKAVLAELAKIK